MAIYADPPGKNDTSGAHKFIRKREMGGLWKAVGVDESRSAVEGDDVDALVEVVVPPKADSGPGTTITVDLGHSDNGEVAAPEGRLSEPLTNQGWQAVNAPDEPDSIVAEMLLDYTTGEVSSESSPPMLEAHSGAVGSGEGEGAAGNQEAAGVQAAAVGEGNRPDLDEPLGARSPVVQHSRQAVEASGGNKAAHRTSEAGPAASGYDAMDLDKPGSQVEAHLLEGASTGVQPHQSHAGWTSEGTGWPEITQTHLQDSMVKRLLLDWEWIWQK